MKDKSGENAGRDDQAVRYEKLEKAEMRVAERADIRLE